MDFVETMAEYLDGYRLDWDNTLTTKLARIEKTYPGFTERYKNFGEDIDRFREETNEEAQDIVLVKLLREGFLIDGVFEEDQIITMQKFWADAAEGRRKFMKKDIDNLIEGKD